MVVLGCIFLIMVLGWALQRINYAVVSVGAKNEDLLRHLDFWRVLKMAGIWI